MCSRRCGADRWGTWFNVILNMFEIYMPNLPYGVSVHLIGRLRLRGNNLFRIENRLFSRARMMWYFSSRPSQIFWEKVWQKLVPKNYQSCIMKLFVVCWNLIQFWKKFSSKKKPDFKSVKRILTIRWEQVNDWQLTVFTKNSMNWL